MKLGILTARSIRHRYVVGRLRESFPVAAVAYEETGYDPGRVNGTDLTADEARIVRHHFTDRDRQEALDFRDHSAFVTTDDVGDVRYLDSGSLNAPATRDFLLCAGVDTVVVYGTNLVKPPLLDQWPGRMINLHLGLSPYYRGAGTNFYPLLNEEPQFVGATIHLLDAGIDSGAILRHARPTIVRDDTPHTIGCKAIAAGVDALIDVLHGLDAGDVTAVPQWTVPNARLYRRRDYHPRQVVDLYRKLDAGLIRQYVDRAARPAAPIRLVD